MALCLGCGRTDWDAEAGVRGKNGTIYCRPECYEAHMEKENAEELAQSLLEGIYRVWWIPNPPREPFYVVCMGLGTAMATLKLLAAYDLFLGEDAVSSNTGGMEVYRKGEGWNEWESEECEDIHEYMDRGKM